MEQHWVDLREYMMAQTMEAPSVSQSESNSVRRWAPPSDWTSVQHWVVRWGDSMADHWAHKMVQLSDNPKGHQTDNYWVGR